MHDIKRPVPLELLQLRSATATYLSMLRDVDAWCEQAIDVNRLAQPDYARRLDQLRSELALTQRAGRVGSVAAIGRLVGELLGEVAP